jgi:ribosomal protein S12 methylthiotransferase
MKIGILSLGCPRNLVDSENLLGRLKNKGYSVVDIQQADTAIVNTCAFIKDAKTESIEAILDLIKLKKDGSLKRIIVCGCLVQRYKDVLKKELPEIDAFVGTVSLNHTKARFPILPRHYAYLKICESCRSGCSFCVIPGIKGKFSSASIESLLQRVKLLDKSGVKELNIVGQDTSSYGLDLYGSKKLPELLKAILKNSKNISWVRLLYLYPDIRLINQLLDLMQREPKICKYIDLPIQHINGRILKLMRRRTTKSDIIRIIELIRKKIPQAAIRTSLIVGFPSETENEFRELFDFIGEVKFERLGVFSYSREEGTPAYNFKGQIPQKSKQARLSAIMLRQQEISAELNQKMLGRVIDVLVEEREDGVYLGRSSFDAPEVDGLVYIRAKKSLQPGDIVKTKITDTLEYDLIAEVQE